MKQIIIYLLITSVCFGQNKIVVKNSLGTTSNQSSGQTGFSIKSFGALGDGVTNNTTYIQLAINAAHAAGGGVVYIPAGIYLTNKLESYTNVTIKGDGYISSFLKSNSADTMIVIHNLPNAIANVTYNDLSNCLIQDVYLEGNSTGTVGFYADRAANFTIEKIHISRFTGKGMILRNCLIGSVNNCRLLSNNIGIYGFADGSNSTATTLVTLRSCGVYSSPKWGIDWSGGGQLKLENTDLSVNGTLSDTLTGGIYYHANSWPGGLHINGGWAEQNLGTVVYIDANVTPTTGSFTSYPPTTTHSITDFQDLGQQYAFTKRNIAIRGENQRLGIINSSITGAVNNVIADGVNNIVTVLNSVFDAANTNLTRNGATIVTK